MRLVTKSALADIAGISRPMVTKLTKGRLASAVHGRHVDVDAPCVVEYLSRGDGGATKKPHPLTSAELERVTDAVFERVVARLVRAARGEG